LPSLIEYYSARAHEYEQVYAKPERQDDLRRLTERVASYFAGRHVLEVACGTGYWTRVIAPRAVAVTACDLSPEVLDLARARQASHPVEFLSADAFALDKVPGAFDAALAGFWVSHVLRSDLRRFLDGLHWRISPGSKVMLMDNRYVEGSNSPVARVDAEGNTYQRRTLNDGSEYEVLKNFLSPSELCETIQASDGERLEIHELTYYWYAIYEAGCA
jgi:demethylmenaquinone methyltransferase/2-methoxy-6-polyprenyl-1,4-benzoquinol methylase